jgi:putative intracellular protease/amidase
LDGGFVLARGLSAVAGGTVSRYKRGKRVAIVVFDGFTDLDVFLPWDLLNRPRAPGWEVRLLGTRASHVSKAGLVTPMHGKIDEARDAAAVLFASGPETRQIAGDAAYLARLGLDPSRQWIGSMCSGALILAALGFLRGRTATTYPTARRELEAYGVTVVEQAFVAHDRVATAAGCLAGQFLAGWVIEGLLGAEARRRAALSVQPVGAGMGFADEAVLREVYGATAAT